MRRSGGAVVLVVIGLACSPIKTAHAPADAAAASAPGVEASFVDVGGTGVAAGRGPAVAGSPAAPVADEVPAALEGRDATPLAVRDVKVEAAGAGRRLIIGLTRAPDDVHDFALSAPPRLVMDL